MKFTIKRLLISTLVLCFVFSSVLGKLSEKHHSTEERQVANQPKAVGKASSNVKKVCCQETYKNGKVSPKSKLSNFKILYTPNLCKSTQDSERKIINLSEEDCKKQKDYHTKQKKKN